MTFTQRLSELLNPPQEPRPGFPWILFRLVSPSLTTLEILLAAVIVTDMMANSGTLRQETAQAIAELAANLDRLKLLPHPAEALAIVLLIHKGGNALMSILEKVLQPLLNAQRELGHAEGRTEGRRGPHGRPRRGPHGRPRRTALLAGPQKPRRSRGQALQRAAT